MQGRQADSGSLPSNFKYTYTYIKRYEMYSLRRIIRGGGLCGSHVWRGGHSGKKGMSDIFYPRRKARRIWVASTEKARLKQDSGRKHPEDMLQTGLGHALPIG